MTGPKATETDDYSCFMMQPYMSDTVRTGRSGISLSNLDQAEFLFFKMLVLSELMNMPPNQSQNLMHKDPIEMYRRAKAENKRILFHQFLEWIREDFKTSLHQIEQERKARERAGYKHNEFVVGQLSFASNQTISGFESELASDEFETLRDEKQIDIVHIKQLNRDLRQQSSRNSEMSRANFLKSQRSRSSLAYEMLLTE